MDAFHKAKPVAAAQAGRSINGKRNGMNEDFVSVDGRDKREKQ
jgi:hypothetical protein